MTPLATTNLLLALVLLAAVPLALLAVAKIRLYHSERLHRLSDACAGVANEAQRQQLDAALCTLLSSTLDRSSTGFVAYYRNHVSQTDRILYMVGALALILATSSLLLTALFTIVIPQMNDLAADTVIAAQYGFSHALEDAVNNLSLTILAVVLVFPSVVAFFRYILRRLPVMYQIAFRDRTPPEPTRTRWSHIMFTTIGVVLPIAFVAHLGYLWYSSGVLRALQVNPLIAGDSGSDVDDVTNKLQAARLLLHYESVCGDPRSDASSLDDIWAAIERRDPNQLLRDRISNMTTSECLKARLGDEPSPDDDLANVRREIDNALRSLADQATRRSSILAGVSTGPATDQEILISEPVAIRLEANEGRMLELAIETAGTYRIDARAISIGFDPFLYLYEDEDVIDDNDDGGEGLNARITRRLEPGSYVIRVEELTGFPGECEVSVTPLPFG